MMDAVERGESFRITRHGHEVAELRPVPSDAFVPVAEAKEALARVSVGDHAALRAEADEVFGEERIGD